MEGKSTVKGTVLVGLSGGVDSAVAAHLLKEEGYQVVGVTLQTLPLKTAAGAQEKPGFFAEAVLEDAARVAAQLGIAHRVLKVSEAFEKEVIAPFAGAYAAGKTPNPCILCNPAVKWGALCGEAKAHSAAYVATGHYAQVRKLSNGRYALAVASDESKDQTYALYRLTQTQLEKTLMPNGAYTKKEIREIAKSIGLSVAEKADSQEICFIPDNDYTAFLARYTKEADIPGNFVSENGEVLGRHKGIRHYTIGQRKGLGLAFGEPKYVQQIRPDTNEVVLGNNESLFQKEVKITDWNGMAIERVEEPMPVTAKIRYHHRPAKCTLYPPQGGILRAVFTEQQRAVTPGQSFVAYGNRLVLGGGVIL